MGQTCRFALNLSSLCEGLLCGDWKNCFAKKQSSCQRRVIISNLNLRSAAKAEVRANSQNSRVTARTSGWQVCPTIFWLAAPDPPPSPRVCFALTKRQWGEGQDEGEPIISLNPFFSEITFGNRYRKRRTASTVTQNPTGVGNIRFADRL